MSKNSTDADPAAAPAAAPPAAPAAAPAAAPTEKKSRVRGPQSTAPEFADVDELTILIQSHRSTTAADNSRMFTRGGFKSAGGIDTVPIKSRVHMVASLVLSIALDSNAAAANEAIGTITQFTKSAKSQASDTAKLDAYSNVAAVDGLSPKGANESVPAFIDRISKHMASNK